MMLWAVGLVRRKWSPCQGHSTNVLGRFGFFSGPSRVSVKVPGRSATLLLVHLYSYLNSHII